MSRGRIAFAVLLLLVLVLETKLRVWGAGFRFSLLFAYAMGLRHGPAIGLTAGALIGAIADVLGGGLLGPELMAAGTVGYMGAFANRGMFLWTPALGAIAALGLTALGAGMSYALLLSFGRSTLTWQVALRIIAMQALINAPFGPFIRPLGRRSSAR